MATAIAPVHRQFTTEQSSAINSITVDGTDIIIVYHSNVDKAYNFTAAESYAQFLSDLMTNDQMLKDVSIGSTVADGRRTGELQTVWYDLWGGAIPPFHYIITNCDSRTDRSPNHA